MTPEPDITVTVIFHREGDLAAAALASLGDLVNVARAAGLAVETQAILDRPDELTGHIVGVRGRWLGSVKEVSFGDLGLSRNAATQCAHGRFLAFLDGDDLWGEEWLRGAFMAANATAQSRDAIWHPEHLYIFNETDLERDPRSGIRSFHSLMHGSDTPGFDPTMLLFHNLWSANALATRELHLRFPYRAVDRSRGLGIEDWSWNLATLAAGIEHRVVPGTVHLIRRRSSQSLDRQNREAGLLPHLPPGVTGLSLP